MSQKNNVKNVTIVEFQPTQYPLEETKDKIPEEPSSDSSESVESLSSEEHEDYLDYLYGARICFSAYCASTFP